MRRGGRAVSDAPEPESRRHARMRAMRDAPPYWLRPMARTADPSKPPSRPKRWRWAPARCALELVFCGSVLVGLLAGIVSAGLGAIAVVALAGAAICNRLEDIANLLDELVAATARAPEPPS